MVSDPNWKPRPKVVIEEENYDMVCTINKSNQFKDGIPINYYLNDHLAKPYFKSIEELAKRAQLDSTLVSITGFANRGKSFLCNKLSDRHISSGFSKRTEGFGIIYS